VFIVTGVIHAPGHIRLLNETIERLESADLFRKAMTRRYALSPLSETDDHIIGMQNGPSTSQVALCQKVGFY
jgi:hypothetical protein